MKNTMLIFAFIMAFVVANVAFAASKDALVEEKCKTCHSTAIVYSKKKDSAAWDATVARMIDRHGAKLTADEKEDILDFLYTLK